MPRYVRGLHTQRNLFQNKMAAKLSTLIRLFLESKPEKLCEFKAAITEVVKRHEFTMQIT